LIESKTILDELPITKRSALRAQKQIDLDGDYREEESDDLHDELEFEMRKDETLEKGAATKKRRVSLAAPLLASRSNVNSNTTTATGLATRKRGRPRLDKADDIKTPKKQQQQQQCAPSSSPFGFGLTPVTNRTSSNVVDFYCSKRGGKSNQLSKILGGARGRVGQRSGR